MASRIINSLQFRFALLLLLSFVRINPSTAAESSPVAGSLTETDVKVMLRDYVDTDKLGVGFVVGMVDEQGTVIIGHGRLDDNAGRDVDGDTVFEIGSVTKVFTALLLQDMVARGEMKLDDPVQKYLPTFLKMPSFRGKQVTLLHLATHTSGLPREVDNLTPRSWRNPGAGYTVEQAYAFLARCRLLDEPGTQQRYSNIGMQLLGHVISLKAGKDYEALVLERICKPLGMSSTRISLTPELLPRVAIGHAMPGRPAPRMDCSAFPAGGALCSTANDLLKFTSAYMGLTPSSLNQLMETAKAYHPLEDGTKRRLAWWGDEAVFEHSGLTLGFSAKLAFDARRRRGVVILSNCASMEFTDALSQPLLAGKSQRPGGMARVKPVVYDRYLGQYRSESGVNTCTVRREGERLLIRWIRPSGGCYPSFEVFPQSDSVFSNSFWNTQSTFIQQSGDGGVKMSLVTPNLHLELRRVSTDIPPLPAPVVIDPGLYDRYVGGYRKTFLFGLIRLGPSFNVRHETDESGEHLVGYITGRNIRKYLPRLSGDILGGEIFPMSETTFFTPLLGEDFRITFLENKKGKVTGMAIRSDDSSINVDRVSRKPAD